VTPRAAALHMYKLFSMPPAPTKSLLVMLFFLGIFSGQGIPSVVVSFGRNSACRAAVAGKNFSSFEVPDEGHHRLFGSVRELVTPHLLLEFCIQIRRPFPAEILFEEVEIVGELARDVFVGCHWSGDDEVDV
jgi:hypothetical protein